MSNYKLFRRESFNIGRAELDVWYELYEKHYTLFRSREVWKPVYRYYDMEATIPERGDEKWAKKIAKHFKIPMPTKPEEN